MLAVSFDFVALAERLGQVFYFIVLPMLLLAGIGYILHRRGRLDLRTLTILNFYFVIPAMIYYSVVTARITPSQAGQTIAFAATLFVAMGVVAWIAARLRRVPPDQRPAMIMCTCYFNAGNYGVPLQDLAFAKEGLSSVAVTFQSIVMICQNFLQFTIGVVMAASGRKDRHWRDNLLAIAKFPPIYALAAGLLTVQARTYVSGEWADQWLTPFWKVVVYVKDAFIALALATLGVQLAAIRSAIRSYPVKLTVVLRLLVGPLIAVGAIYALGIDGMLAQVLLITSSTPTAINVMLLCTQFDNHAEFAARAVFYSTLLSPLTVTLAVFVARGGFLPGF